MGTGPQIAFGPPPQTTLFDTTSSGLNQPFGVAIDGKGNIYLADTGNARVLKETYTVGGTYTQTTIGSGWSNPYSVAVDAAGSLYVADPTLNSVMKETPDGTGGYIQTTAIDGHNPSTSLASPTDAVVDERGNLYIVDYGHGRVVKDTLSAGGYTQSVVVNGLHLPWGVAVDAAGNVYITNSYASDVLKETPAGSGYTQSTIGSGWNLPVGIAVDASGNVYVTDYWNNNFVEVTPSGTQTAVGGGWNSIRDVVLDGAGNIYVADGGNNRIEELNVATPPSLTFATPTMAGTTDTTDGVRSLAITNIGNAPLVFTIPGTGSNPSVSTDFTLMTGGAACPSLTSSSFSTSTLAVAASCNLSVAFAPVALASGSVSGSTVLTDNNLNAATGPGTQQSIALSGTATTPPMDATSTSIQINPAVATTGSSITITVIVSDTTNSGTMPIGSVTLTDTLGTTVTPLNGGNPVPLTSTGVTTLSGVTLNGAGQHTITATYAAVTGFDASTNTITATVTAVTPDPISPTGTAAAYVPVTLTFTTSGTLGSIHVLTQGAPNLDFTDAATSDTCSAGTNYSAGATCVVNVIFTPKYAGPRYGAVVLEDGLGNLLTSAYVNGVGTGSQLTFANSTQGNFAPTSASTLGGTFGFNGPSGVAVDGSGNVFIADTGNHAVEEIPAGCILSTCVITLGGSFQFGSPLGVAVDGAGNLFVSDNGGRAVYELLAAGGYTTINSLGNSTSNSNPKGIAVDGVGNVYVSGSNNAVYEIPVGAYNTSEELGGNFLNPGGVAVDGSGNVYVADSNNMQLKKMPANCFSPACVTTLHSVGYPSGIAIDVVGNLYVTNGALTELQAVDGYSTLHTLATASSVTSASSVAVVSNGNVFFTNGNSIQEFDYADAPSIAYPTSTLVGANDTADGPQNVTVSNIGNAPLTFSSVTYPADFSATVGFQGSCLNSAPLVAGSGCILPINFTPTQTGSPLSESLLLAGSPLSGTSLTQLISLSGSAIPAPVATTAISSTVLTMSQSTTAFKPVAGSGGTGTLTYSVAPALPAGLSLSSSTGIVSGSPTASSAATTYTVTVTDTNSATATATFVLVVSRQTSTTIASVGQSSITPIQSVTLTATVAATITGTPIVPSGMVTFFDGTTQLESPVSVTNGVATLLVSALPSGETATITATYSGDGNFLASTSNTSVITVTVAPLDSTFTTTGTTAYTLAPGAVATYTFALSPFYGSYVGPVSFAVTGLPAGATASFTPNSVPADGGATQVVMTVQTAPATAHNDSRSSPFGRWIVLAFLLLPFAGKRSVREKLKGRMLLLVLLMAGLTASLTGCGSSNGFLLQNSHTYTLTVTTTSGTLQHNQTVTLIVQ